MYRGKVQIDRQTHKFNQIMGVIRGNQAWMEYGLPPNDIEDIVGGGVSSDDEPALSSPRRKLTRPRNKKALPRDSSITESVAQRRKSWKQARRCNNLRELVNLVEREELEVEFTAYEPTMSAFADLFMVKEKMLAWNTFINSTEEEQREILEEGFQAHEKSNSCECSSDSDLDDSWEKVDVQSQDKRSTHPSFSAEECFQKISKNIKTMLKRRHKPMGMLFSLEDAIIDFFTEWPTSVYISKSTNSYERMMIHALCQYLDLISKSYDNDGTRQTQVENPQETFTPPPVRLTQYLESSGSRS